MATKSLIKKTRRPRGSFPKVEKELSHVTAEQVLSRHLYCVPARFALGVAYCDHPQDGWCKVGGYPTDLELQEINTRLSGKGSETSLEMSNPMQVRTRQRRSGNPKTNQYFCMKCEKFHVEPVTQAIADGFDWWGEHLEFKRHRGQRLPSQLKPKAPAKFFCLNCNDWHQEPDIKFLTHAKYKRKRGRQKGWNKK